MENAMVSDRPVKAYWSRSPRPGNFGDILNPTLIGKISGRPARWMPQRTPGVHFCIGSILGGTAPGTIVWGTGIMSAKTRIDPRADFRAVRGPLSRKAVMKAGGKCPDIYGDPALLLPLFFRPRVEKEFRLGVFPHYVDLRRVEAWKRIPNVLVMNPLSAKPLTVTNDICRCERVISSSLHGLIVANAYGIPALWVEFGGKLSGDGSKFRDFFLSVGETPYEPLQLRDGPVDFDAVARAIPPVELDIDLDKLLAACPFGKGRGGDALS